MRPNCDEVGCISLCNKFETVVSMTQSFWSWYAGLEFNGHFIMPIINLPVWYSSLCLLLASITALTYLCQVENENRQYKRKRSRKGKKTRFRRRKLPYHLVRRCYARPRNRPERLSGPSRREIYIRKLLIRREKRRKYRRNKTTRTQVAFYEYTINSGPPPKFQLVEPDIDLIVPAIERLGPGGIPFEVYTDFGLDDPNAKPDNLQGLICRTFDVGRHFNGLDEGTVYTTPLVFDTGASGAVTPYKADFIDYMETDIEVQAVVGVGNVVGMGTVLRRFKCRDGSTFYCPSQSYHMPTSHIRLESPQSIIQSLGGFGKATLIGNNIEWLLPDGRIVDIPICPRTNLPLLHDFVCSDDEKRVYGARWVNNITYANECAYVAPVVLEESDRADYEERKSIDCCQCVTDQSNKNLNGPQKELLHWHHRLCLNMKDLQHLMRSQKIRDSNGKVIREQPPIIPTKFRSTKSLKPEQYPCCMACKLATAKARGTGVKTSTPVPGKTGILSRDKYEPGDMISTDQYVVKTPGRLEKGYGKEQHTNCYHGGTIYQDAASNLVRVQNQVSLGAGETVMGKAAFEDWIWNLAGVLAKQYHSDNGIFNSELFRRDCIEKQQKQTFSGVGAKHQNSRAERTIQTISYWARSMMVHAALHWPSDGADNIRLWAFAVSHAAWLYIRLPNKHLGWKSPLEVFTKTKSDHRDLLRTHVWGCPVFVLEAKLQDGHKIPKFNRRARMGQFLGFSDEHSSLVARVRNLNTNFVSPQFHVVFDDHFSSIYNDSRLEDTKIESIFEELFENCRDYYGEETLAPEGATNSQHPAEQPHDECTDCSPELENEWLTESEQRDKKERIDKWRNTQREIREREAEQFEKLNSDYNPPYPLPSSDVPDAALISDDESDSDDSDAESSIGDGGPDFGAPEGAADTAPEGAAPAPPAPAAQPRRSERLRRDRRAYNPKTRGLRDGIRDGAYEVNGERLDKHPDFTRCYTSLVTDRMRDAKYFEKNRSRFACTLGTKQPPRSARLTRKKQQYKARLFKKKMQTTASHFGAMEWEVPTPEALMHSDLARFVHFAAADCGFDGSIESLVINWLHPLILAAKTISNKEDNPNWMQAMNGPFAKEYWEAACIEVETLEKMDAWDVVERTSDMNVLPSTWAFKCKRFPDGLIKKFKARFCARGDRQIEGVDYFNTYAPVVQWVTIRLMLILECLLGLVSKQGDVTCAFLHAHLEEGENVYLAMPQGFTQYDKRGRAKVLRLKRTLYGLKQSPRAFWKYMVEKLESCDMRQSELDPCLFIGDTCVAVMYVDDILLWSTDEKHIYSLGTQLRKCGVDLEEEDDAAGFLGVKLTKVPETGQMIMTQEGLINRIIEALGLDVDKSTPRNTPCLKAPLTKDLEGDPASGSFSYASVVGMLLYLSGHSRPDIAYSVSQVARFTFAPRHSHEQALKLIGRYLLATRDKGLVLTPTSELNIDAYPDADFAGLYGYEDSLDPVCVRSRTGFVINVANCPVLWKSSLQTETATSTMQAEIIALAACCRELIPIIDLVDEVGTAVGLAQSENPKMHVRIHEDNAGALTLAQTVPPQMTPQSKHYAVKTHWFREKIIELGISIQKISTVEQIGDICTKCLPQATFEYLRKKLMGW